MWDLVFICFVLGGIAAYLVVLFVNAVARWWRKRRRKLAGFTYTLDDVSPLFIDVDVGVESQKTYHDREFDVWLNNEQGISEFEKAFNAWDKENANEEN